MMENKQEINEALKKYFPGYFSEYTTNSDKIFMYQTVLNILHIKNDTNLQNHLKKCEEMFNE